MRLRTKFVIVFVAVTLVLSGSILLALEFYKRDAVGESQANVDETATLAAEQIDASIRDRRDYLGLVASRPRARQFDRSGPFLDALLANSRFYAVQITAANGTVVDFRGDVTAAHRHAVLGANRSEAPYVREALRGQSHVGEVEATDDGNAHILVFAAPIFEGGDVKGVLAAAIYLDTRTTFDALPPLETSRQTVTVVGNEMEIHGSDRTFTSSIEGSATVDATGWEVSVVRDRTALDARLRRLGLFQAGQLGLAVVVMVGFGYWQYAASLRQTERLLEGFADLGAGDYGRTVALHGGTEWEQISDGFNDLATTLAAREAALRERTQRLEVMYRVLRHNLRNQLSVVLTYADVIADVTDDDQIRAAARSIHDAGRRLTSLSERARQIETALDAEHERTRVEVSAVVAEITTDLREAYPDVDLATTLPDEAWAVALPSLRMAIESVCENACEHTDADEPRVEISVTAVDEAETTGWIHVTVVDNGPGLPQQDRAAIREGRETALEHASGLGLWLTYWIVDSSGGDLEFTDAEPRGTVVEIHLPQAREEADDDWRADTNRADPESP
ncbi:sensor histidine kinase [Salinigranum salinum]|uniref:sensor histidine kinase n=1 Tax=Salinigranum salinum TaxID=1364937 RepID=UPI001260984C|nr:sensor histidine kinase [Salinigranum salinum]